MRNWSAAFVIAPLETFWILQKFTEMMIFLVRVNYDQIRSIRTLSKNHHLGTKSLYQNWPACEKHKMTKKRNNKSIYVGEPIERLLADRASDSGLYSISGTLNAVADRYQSIVRRAMPKLALNEWMLIMDAMSSTFAQSGADIDAYGLVHNIEDAIALDGLDKKWEIDGSILIQKLRGHSFAGLVALLDAVERYWAKGTRVVEDPRAEIEAIVGKGNVE
jgi:hypothetical protein